MNRTALIIITIALVIGLVLIFSGGSGSEPIVNNVEVKDGVQYITIKAGGGYFPSVSSAQAGLPTKLVMETGGSFDCSAALVIQSIGYQKMLPQIGKTEIDIGTREAGVPLEGTCSMGMYSFTVNFI